ncbi:hypothetical protein Pmar_PMAR000752 [Perkinsus marinus ATCC 50983]|uniref:DUF1015 domain-containing protein n=1 Tax=Perkinsus marinus (strain ATCC 50983 / TXsc) TaxID=423536 RepID=C5KXI3_PERM5|nr:hypothetical protein Pmar_PMAR000752 [Perkinsus marinus ATCC 50983]EER10707.1 hypothetical protein Pmar_PMAR000752 [Perkinsus marinus ATCC 50983]|eukprot:XP_002778912.1 hypothetical protein Pmar_PMAR000752 [Perkinsus marinus ATCC 50983]
MTSSAEELFSKVGVRVPYTLLPAEKVDKTKWTVIACDQYTSEPDYWERVEQFVGSEPSTLRLMFPEVYLEKGHDEEILKSISDHMAKYTAEGVLVKPEKAGMVVLQRTTKTGAKRIGLVTAVDLEMYDYSVGSQSKIRPTEATIESRIPPRLNVRRNAPVELPHIMVLIDDPEKTVLEPLFAKRDELKQVYDFDLMENGGHLSGWWVDGESSQSAEVAKALNVIAEPERFHKLYDASADKKPLIFAVGDGNHSLATARAYWQEVKATLSDPEEIATHPARFALVEIENIHDDGLAFEAIHRLIFDANGGSRKFITEMTEFLEKEGCGPVTVSETEEDFKKAVKGEVAGHSFGYMVDGVKGGVFVANPKKVLDVATVMDFVDPYMKSNEAKGTKIDYVHGLTAIERYCTAGTPNVGIVLPDMHKSDLFKTVVHDGALPRKTFSMGEADEKRFYYECRRIQKD